MSTTATATTTTTKTMMMGRAVSRQILGSTRPFLSASPFFLYNKQLCIFILSLVSSAPPPRTKYVQQEDKRLERNGRSGAVLVLVLCL